MTYWNIKEALEKKYGDPHSEIDEVYPPYDIDDPMVTLQNGKPNLYANWGGRRFARIRHRNW